MFERITTIQRISSLASAIIVISAVFAPTTALAWGPEGHRFTGHVAGDDDAGANFKNMLLPGATNVRRLHSVWDSEFVKLTLRGVNEREYAQQLLSRYRSREMRDWQESDVRDWTNESLELSKSVVYARLPGFVCREQWTATPVQLPQSYVDAAVDAIPGQLAKAGARIAATLNTALDPTPYIEGPVPVRPLTK